VRNHCRRSDGWTARGLLAVLLALTVYPSTRLVSQSDPRLKAAVDLAQSGQVDSARSIVRRLLATMSPRDSAYPQALFTQGMLAPDAATVTSNLQRVVVEYGWSPWAANALMRLAQLSYTQGDPASAIQSVQRLRRDYPDSPVKPRADFWGAKANAGSFKGSSRSALHAMESFE